MTTENPVATTEGKRQRCREVKADGSRCRAWATASGLCIFHTPGGQEARRKGGMNSSRKARADKLLPLRLRPLLELLEQALVEVHDGNLGHSQGSAMATLAGAIVKLYESGVLEERLTALEQRAAGGNHSGKFRQ